jgi:tetratricopeptide (TPR) repeat protein
MHIQAEPTPYLAIADEILVLRAALERDAGSARTRLRLAELCNEQDDFDTVISLLEGQNTYPALMMLATACLARQSHEDAQRAVTATADALELSANDVALADALSLRAKALDRAGLHYEVEPLLRRSLELCPHNVGAFKRLVLHYLRGGKPDQALALADSMLSAGISHARVLAARCMALAAVGRVDEAQKLAGIDDFLFHRPLETPQGWESIERFNEDVVAELTADPAMRFARFGTASEHSWRIDHPATTKAPAVRTLIEAIATVAGEYASSLGDEHAWISARPANAKLRSWCVITGAEGHEQWHMHPHGWMSGGYYPQVPDNVDVRTSKAGCLALGLPGGMIGENASTNFGETLVHPKAGLLTLFPSHTYHRTYPHGADSKRICIAFDICPA